MGRRSSRSPMATAIKDKDSQKKIELLTAGSMVEVSSNEEGFEGAFYVAKVLKSSSKRKDRVLVQYQNLVVDNVSNEPLTESVEVSFTRPVPLPPAADQTFELHDVVDAFHRDGWWTGVVANVLGPEGKRKYTVVFHNPPEKIDFSSENLRFHLVWTDGNWVRPPKPKRMDGLEFGKGMAVEVNFDGESLQHAWYPAIVLEEVGFNSFLVEYSRSKTDGKMTEIVDSFHIRPPPPYSEVQNFDILQCVEAFHDSCWRKGTIVTTLILGRYNVFLESEKEEMQFRHSETRPHQRWINGKWVEFRCEEQSAHVRNGTKHSEVVASVKSRSTVQHHSGEKSTRRKMSNAMDQAREKFYAKKSRKNLLDAQKESNAFGHQDKGEQHNLAEGTTREMELEISAKEVELSAVANMENEGEQVNVSEGTASQLELENTANEVVELSTVVNMENGGEQHNVFEGTASQMEFENSASKEVELSTAANMENGDVMVGTSSIVPIADHTAKVGASCDAFNNNQCDQEGNVENFNQSSIVQADSELVMNREMPFTKSSFFWQHVDSLDVFRFLPQKPHFSPLFKSNEATREGFAITHMLNFNSLVECTSKLRPEEPRHVLDGYMKALSDLEMHGFDVKAVVERIKKLLSIKTRQEQLHNQSKVIHGKIVECDGKKAKMEEEINAIDKVMKELEEKRAMKVSEKLVIDSESYNLQMDANRINEDILIGKLDFESQAAAPWQICLPKHSNL